MDNIFFIRQYNLLNIVIYAIDIRCEMCEICMLLHKVSMVLIIVLCYNSRVFTLCGRKLGDGLVRSPHFSSQTVSPAKLTITLLLCHVLLYRIASLLKEPLLDHHTADMLR